MGQAMGNVGLIFKREVVGSCHIQVDGEPQKSSDLPGAWRIPKAEARRRRRPRTRRGTGRGQWSRWGRQSARVGVVPEEAGEELFAEKGMAGSVACPREVKEYS